MIRILTNNNQLGGTAHEDVVDRLLVLNRLSLLLIIVVVLRLMFLHRFLQLVFGLLTGAARQIGLPLLRERELLVNVSPPKERFRI